MPSIIWCFLGPLDFKFERSNAGLNHQLMIGKHCQQLFKRFDLCDERLIAKYGRLWIKGKCSVRQLHQLQVIDVVTHKPFQIDCKLTHLSFTAL